MNFLPMLVSLFLCLGGAQGAVTQGADDDPAPKPYALVYCDAQDPTLASMQRDIDLLKSENPEQTYSDTYYQGLPKKLTLTVADVDSSEIRFIGKSQVFQGDYAGQFEAGRSYPYYETADMGGKRYYIVKDTFGVWITFKYVVPIGQ